MRNLDGHLRFVAGGIELPELVDANELGLKSPRSAANPAGS